MQSVLISIIISIDSARSKHSVHSDARKKDRRKVRASSLESSAESESSAMETGDGNSGQVAAVSSTASFKSPAVGIGEEETNGEKQVKRNKYATCTSHSSFHRIHSKPKSARFSSSFLVCLSGWTVQLKKNCAIPQRTCERSERYEQWKQMCHFLSHHLIKPFDLSFSFFIRVFSSVLLSQYKIQCTNCFVSFVSSSSCRQRRSVSVAVNASVVKRKTTAAIVHHAVTIKVIRFANNVAAKS